MTDTLKACGNCHDVMPGNLIGHEIPDVYDGVLFWSCTTCGWSWSRGWEGRRGHIADNYIRERNSVVAMYVSGKGWGRDL